MIFHKIQGFPRNSGNWALDQWGGGPGPVPRCGCRVCTMVHHPITPGTPPPASALSSPPHSLTHSGEACSDGYPRFVRLLWAIVNTLIVAFTDIGNNPNIKINPVMCRIFVKTSPYLSGVFDKRVHFGKSRNNHCFMLNLGITTVLLRIRPLWDTALAKGYWRKRLINTDL